MGRLLFTAVLSAFSSWAWAQERALPAQINHALDQARPAVLTHLREAVEDQQRCGLLGLVLLAAIHDGVPEDDERRVAALAALQAAKPEECYDLALRLLVFEALPQTPERVRIAKADLRSLLAHQSDDGGFHYRPRSNHWDLSNTQYAALGLRAAAAMGLDVDRRVWMRMAKAVSDMQDNYGGFGYSPAHGRGKSSSYASMTAAGIAALAVCQQHLEGRSATTKKLDKEIGRGWQWFARNATVLGAADERHSFYFHYGLERAAILCDVEKVGETDWYEAGARMLVAAQQGGGGWRSAVDAQMTANVGAAGDPVSTSFAVLFLRRKFQKLAGPITQHIVGLVNLGPHSPDKDVQACAEQLAARGKEAMTEVLRALRSEIGPQRRAAGAALLAIAGDAFGFDPDQGVDGNRDAVRAAELWYLRNR